MLTDKEAKILKKFGSSVRKYRENLKISQSELAWQVEVDRSYISDIERGKRNVSLLVMLKLGKALKIDVTDLIS